jgi:hypothetical protein
MDGDHERRDPSVGPSAGFGLARRVPLWHLTRSLTAAGQPRNLTAFPGSTGAGMVEGGGGGVKGGPPGDSPGRAGIDFAAAALHDARVADPLDVDLDLLHLVAIAPDAALPADRMRAVLVRELARLSIALGEHFAIEEEVAHRTGAHEPLVEEHRRLAERVRHTRDVVQAATSVSAAKAALNELLDALGDHERSETEGSTTA